MVVEVPRKKLIEFIVHFEDLLGRAYGFVGLHPHEFPRNETESLDKLRDNLVIYMKSIVGEVSEIVSKESEDAKVDGEGIAIEIVDGIPFVVKEPVEEEDEAKKEIEPESEPEPENIEPDSGEGDSAEGAEPIIVLDEAAVEEPIVEAVEEIIEVEEEIELDEEVEEEGSEIEESAEAKEKDRKALEELEAQLEALKVKIGD